MINYIIHVLLFQTVFLAVYDLVLKKETFFQWNRAYLIFTSVLVYLLPLIKLQTIYQNLPQKYIVLLPEVMLSPTTYIEKQIDWSVVLFETLGWTFIIGMVVSSLLFLFKLFQILILISKNNPEKTKDYSLVLLQESNIAFSFFNYIFLGKTTEHQERIVSHELIHVKQKHSLDLLLFEMQKIVFWFNPYSYLFQKRVSEVHEFIADSKTVDKKNKSNYFQSMLAEVFQVEKFAFVNAFNKQSIIKKRIMMLSKNKSKEILKFKYLLMIPLLMGMLIYSSCETSSNKTVNKQSIQEIDKNKPDTDIIPFGQIDQVPIFPGCEDIDDQKACMVQKISEHVANNFNVDLSKNLGLEPGKKRVYVQFKVDKEGKIVDVRARGPHIDLEEEAVRVINSIPQMQPGEENGKKVGVKYTLPITLVIE